MLKKIITQSRPRGLECLGFSAENIDALKEEVKELLTKQLFKIKKIEPHPKYNELTNITFMFGTHEVMLSIFLPTFKETEALGKEIDEIEKDGLEKAKEFGLYSEKQLKTLERTFCAGLVTCAYPPQFYDHIHHKHHLPGFTETERRIFDFLMRALFSNDDKRDSTKHRHSEQAESPQKKTMPSHLNHPQIVESPEEIDADNELLMKWIEADEDQVTHLPPSKRGAALREIIAAIKKNGNGDIPRYFIETLQDYLESTKQEAVYMFDGTWPNETTLGTVKKDSSGSNHATAAGAAMRNLEPKIEQNLNLKYIRDFTAQSVAHNNDVYSHIKETHERLKKLLEILEQINIRFEEFEANLSAPNKIEDHNIRFLAQFYLKIQDVIKSFDCKPEDISPDALLLQLLDLIPSFNLIDVLVHEGKHSLTESYAEVAKKGNNATEAVVRNIRQFSEEIKTKPINIIPKPFRNNSEEFLRQANIWINIITGWCSQSLWAYCAPRYNEALVNTGPPHLLETSKKIKEQVINRKGATPYLNT
jgi:hypothetical protein